MTKEITLTGEQLKELKDTGHTQHTKAGITYIVGIAEDDTPVVESAIVLSEMFPLVNFIGARSSNFKVR